jgi:hypothetical protein
MLYIIISLVLGTIFNVQCADSLQSFKAQEIKAFFDRSDSWKAIENLERVNASEHLLFFASHDRLEPKVYGTGICEIAKLFIGEIQERIDRRTATFSHMVTGYEGCVNYVLTDISKHARYICNVCCRLQLKVIAQEPLGQLDAKNPLYLLWPWTKVCAQKFYDSHCTSFYKTKTEAELIALFEATK